MPTTISGTIKNLDTTTPGTSSFVRFWLRGARGNEPRITATGAIAPQAAGSSFYVDIPADASGNVSGSIYSTRASDGIGNGEIEVSGSYIAVYYGMQIYNASIPGPEVPVHAKQGATLNIANVTPTSTATVVTAPTGDTTYLRLDAGNSPITGAVTFTSTAKLTGSGADAATSEGNLYYRTDLHRVRFYDGTAWRSIPGLDTIDTLTSKTLTSPVITGTAPFNRIRANQGSALVSGDWSLGGNWGTSPTLSSIMGTDAGGAVTVNSGSGSPGVNPTLSLVFHDGAWATAPIVVFSAGGPVGLVWNITSRSATGFTVTFSGTPAASIPYGFNFIAIGQP